MVKIFRLCFTIFAILICVVNATGMDDKNLILFFTSPHLMFLEDYSRYVRTIVGNETLQMMVWYLINIIGWFFIGWLIDIIVTRLNENKY